jgi:hypothetical protein
VGLFGGRFENSALIGIDPNAENGGGGCAGHVYDDSTHGRTTQHLFYHPINM